MPGLLFFGVVALLAIGIGWLAWPQPDELDLAPQPSRLKMPGIAMTAGGLGFCAWSIWSSSEGESLATLDSLAPQAALFVGGCLLAVSGIILVAAAAIVDAIHNKR
jgi:hypothetical protein